MLRHVTFSLKICAAAALAAALLARPSQAITFGEIDSENRFPNVGAIVLLKELPNFPVVPVATASGVLIHPRVLLTAGHVTASIEASLDSGLVQLDDGRVSFGTNALDPTTWVEFESVITHPGYSFHPQASSQDVGVIILKKPVHLPCATLAYEGLLDDLKDAGLLIDQGVPERFLAVGYGATLDFAPPEITPSDALRRFSFSDYRALEKNWLYMNQNPATGNSGTGYGDSGGPRFWRSPDGELILVGITSRGDPELVSNDIAYRVDTADALGFIDFVFALVEGKSH